MAKRTASKVAEEPASMIPVLWKVDESVQMQHADYLHYRILQDQVVLTVGQFDLMPQDDPRPGGVPVPLRTVSRLVLSTTSLKAWAALLAQAVATLPEKSER